jgi:hypothetical protein
MSFITSLFRKEKHAESAVLITVGANSVAGAYAYYKEGEIPSVLYTLRIPIEAREGELREHSSLRVLDTLCKELIREGAPILLRTSGTGSADKILVSIDAPWQGITVRTERFERESPFIFTRNMVNTAIEETSAAQFGKILADESVVGTVLNGYETHDPYGKMTRHASVTVLASFIDTIIAEGVSKTIINLYHTKKIQIVAGSSIRYQAMRIAFPHEHDALILDSTGSRTSVALVYNNLLSAVSEIKDIENRAWIDVVSSELAELAKDHPLPRILFLLANETDMASLRQALDAANFNVLWLSDNPPKIIPVLASHLVGLVSQATATTTDPSLLLMALYNRPHPFVSPSLAE